ncbi:MAG: FliA/WhiG family RNA polymerase sigma factor [Candidatus Gastranaerophilaceae bacterium]
MDTTTSININDRNIKKLSEEDLASVWAEFIKDRENKVFRDKLIVQYIYLIKYVVGRIRVNLPNTIATEDITGYGVEGLINAIERFSPEKGSRFETYALVRIRGTIIDKIRNQDWVPRSTRRKQKEIKNAFELLQKKLGRKPTTQEVATELNLPKEKVEATINGMDSGLVISIYDKRDGSTGEGMEIIDTIEDSNAKDPLSQLEEKDVKKDLSSALSKLPEREKMILALYYHENMTLKEIGEAINVSESRVCQLHAQAIMKLRNLLSNNKQGLRKTIV